MTKKGKGATEKKPEPSRFRQQPGQTRPARGTRPVYAHGHVVYVQKGESK